jgi:cyclopropane-fatty-acyl-phospholipid synthase
VTDAEVAAMATEMIERPAPPRTAEPATAGTQRSPNPSRVPAADARRTAIARAALRTISKAMVDPGLLAIEYGGSEAGPTLTRPGPRARVIVEGPDAVARLLFPPTPDAFAEAYLRRDVEIEGDVMAAVQAGEALDLRRLHPTDLRRLVRWGLAVRRCAAPAKRLERVARMRGQRHSRARDMAAIRFHYDVGEDFYRLWLDRRLTYSCAYFESAQVLEADLDAAQEAKLDLICRKLRLREGQRLLDIGCGWGSLLVFAAQRYGIEALGVTLSERQAAEANRRAAAVGLGDRARAEVRDYRDLGALGRFDAVASVGMFEHVGRRNLGPYFRAAYEALLPGGRLLNHGIATTRSGSDWARRPGKGHFVDRYVFPDGELVTVERAIGAARRAGFELFGVESLRPHYALTLAAWVRRLEAAWDAAIEAAGEEVARTWRLYVSAARLGFERGELDVVQLLLARPEPGVPAQRALRPWW